MASIANGHQLPPAGIFEPPFAINVNLTQVSINTKVPPPRLGRLYVLPCFGCLLVHLCGDCKDTARVSNAVILTLYAITESIQCEGFIGTCKWAQDVVGCLGNMLQQSSF